MKRAIIGFLVLLIQFNVSAQEQMQSGAAESSLQSSAGVSITPSRLRMSVPNGQTEVHTIKINNDTDSPNSFRISVMDFDMDENGKTVFLPAEEAKFSLSEWVSISPSFVELEPHEKKEVTVTVSVPNTADARRAAWSIMMVEQAKEREILDPGSGASGNNMAFGIVPTFAFGIYMYQNPPNVQLGQVNITGFNHYENDSKLELVAENNGRGISYCSTYIELTNLDNGEVTRLPTKQFTILPGILRKFAFPLPEDLPTGNYSALGVIDFGSKAQLKAAQKDFTISSGSTPE